MNHSDRTAIPVVPTVLPTDVDMTIGCPPPYGTLRVVPGLERLYHGRQPWLGQAQQDEYAKLHLDTNNDGGARGYVFNGAFEGSMELQAAVALYDAVRAHVREAKASGRTEYAMAETGTCDGLSTAFIARALKDAAETRRTFPGRVWTCEWDDVRSTGVPRPWPKLWDELGLGGLVTPCVGDSRHEETWETGGRQAGKWARTDRPLPRELDALFIDSLHTEAQVMAEWDLLKGRLRAGGIVLMHDVFLPDVQGVEVARAMGRIAAELGAEPEFLDSCRGLALIRKPE